MRKPVLLFLFSLPAWANYSYYRSLTVDHTKVPNTDQSNFPVLVYISDGTFKDAAHGGHVQNSSGYDIGFFSDSGGTTKLFWEVESYDNVNGVLRAWVKVPTVSHTSNTVFYVFYDDASINSFQSTVASVWDSHFKAVWHLSDNAASRTVVDSTGNFSGTNQANTNTKTATGEIDGALSYGGTSDYTSTAYGGTLGDFTVELWFKVASSSDNTSSNRLVDKSYSAGIWLGKNGTTANSWGGGCIEPGSPYGIYVTLADGSWHHLVSRRTGTRHDVIGDGGAATASNSVSSNALSSTAFYIAAITGGGSSWFKGTLDEVRISDVARSDDWISAEYNNQSSPGTFLSIGSESVSGCSAARHWILL